MSKSPLPEGGHSFLYVVVAALYIELGFAKYNQLPFPLLSLPFPFLLSLPTFSYVVNSGDGILVALTFI